MNKRGPRCEHCGTLEPTIKSFETQKDIPIYCLCTRTYIGLNPT